MENTFDGIVEYDLPVDEFLDSQAQDELEAAYYQCQELYCLQETLDQDPIANHIIRIGKTKIKLVDWMVFKFGLTGELPESFSKSEAASIKHYPHGYKWPDHMLNKQARVKAEYLFDELQDKFHLGYDQLREHLNNLLKQTTRLAYLKKH